MSLSLVDVWNVLLTWYALYFGLFPGLSAVLEVSCVLVSLYFHVIVQMHHILNADIVHIEGPLAFDVRESVGFKRWAGLCSFIKGCLVSCVYSFRTCQLAQIAKVLVLFQLEDSSHWQLALLFHEFEVIMKTVSQFVSFITAQQSMHLIVL
jgi:hypothetical protein